MRDNKKTAVNLVPDYHDLWAKRVFYSGSAIDRQLQSMGNISICCLVLILSRLELHLRIVFLAWAL
jgi:hypothetical protein